MNHLERTMAAITLKKPDRVPVAPQNSHFAACFAGYDLMEYSLDPKKQALAHMECQSHFGYDAIISGGDTAILAEACGCDTEYSELYGPRITGHILESLEDVSRLKPIDPYKHGRLRNWIEATRIMHDTIGNSVCIISRADQGAFSLATLLRGIDRLMMDIAMGDKTELLHQLLRYCNSCIEVFIRALADAGAHVVTSGDSISGPDVVSPGTYRIFSLPYEQALSRACRDLGVPFSIHICGKTDAILDDWITSNAEIFEIDHKTDFTLAHTKTAGRVCLLGNLDCSEVLTSGTPELVSEKGRIIIQAGMPESGLILSSGCLMNKNTPVENMEALVECSRIYGVYP